MVPLVCTVGGFQSPAAVPVVTEILEERENMFHFLLLFFTLQILKLSKTADKNTRPLTSLNITKW